MRSRYLAIGLLTLMAQPALAQRVNENPLASAEDAFGASIGTERIGLYSVSDVRGFSPVSAGNVRLEGLYIDRAGSFTDRLVGGSTIRVGLTAQDYSFPAPTGIADYKLRSVGARPMVSVVTGFGAYDGGRLEIDAQLPLVDDRLGLAAGVAAYQDEYASGADARLMSYAATLRWQPRPSLEIIPFWSRIDTWDREAAPYYSPSGPVLPPAVARRRYRGPNWADTRNISTNIGVISRGHVAGWNAALGIFRSINDTPEAAVQTFNNLSQSGQARRLIALEPAREIAATSGELRLSRGFVEADRRHEVFMSVRARDRSSVYGGGVTLDYGTTSVDAALTADRPRPTFGPQTHDQVRQWLAGFGYGLRWRGVGSASLGLQRTHYSKAVAVPLAPPSKAGESAWLPTAALSLQASRRLAVYGSYTRGLEESGVAPDSAANRGQALPAIFTDQTDIGVRWIASERFRVVTGLFRIEKPYFAADEANTFVELGQVRHQGLEISVTATPIKALSVVAGAVLMEPEVVGQPVAEGRIGSRPVGQAKSLLTANLSYDLRSVPGLALTLAANHRGPRPGDRLNRVTLPAVTTVDAGFRYRLTVGETPALLRLQVTNLTDNREWKVVSSGTYEVAAPRTATLFLTLDF